jgi:hypothetical protein
VLSVTDPGALTKMVPVFADLEISRPAPYSFINRTILKAIGNFGVEFQGYSWRPCKRRLITDQ